MCIVCEGTAQAMSDLTARIQKYSEIYETIQDGTALVLSARSLF